MSAPDWFIIIEQWKVKGMGSYGVTLPFIVGALAYAKGERAVSVENIREVLSEIIESPVKDYITVVRWCGDIDEPVFSIREPSDPYSLSISDFFLRRDGNGRAVVFTEDLMSMINLDCKTAAECREKLVERAKEHVEKGFFSKSTGAIGILEFGEFTGRDLTYIKDVLNV
jgi:hypothetical protein